MDKGDFYMGSKIQIISDSCCDITPAMRKTINLMSAPLKITVNGDKEYIDDVNIDTKKMLAEMKASKKSVSTAAPAPGEYAELMEKADESVVITLSQKLSGSYNAAISARDMVLEEFPDKKILVLDSKSASAGETLIALELYTRIAAGASFEELKEQMPEFINNMRTYFVLEDLGNLIKNGRIPHMAGKIGTLLMLRPIMGENGDGEIIAIEKVRGTQKAMQKLVEIVGAKISSCAENSLRMVISYCECADRAADLKKKFLEKYPHLKEVIIVPTTGLSSTYANTGGVVVAVG